MPVIPPAASLSGMPEPDGIEVREATAADVVAGTGLLAESLGFTALDRIPPWLVRDAQEAGAVALAAVSGFELVGFSLALPALARGGPELFSCGLAVSPSHRARGIGRRLKLAQRARALERGMTVIRWRADPLNAPALRLYLDGLGARVVGYRAAAYHGVREHGPVPHDDVDVEWRLDEAEERVATGTRLVELPWGGTRSHPDAESHRRWRLRVRRQIGEALQAGSVGVGVDRDPVGQRAWMRFEAGR